MTFERVGDRLTRIHLETEVEGDSASENVAGGLLGIVKAQVHGDLVRFKELIESRDEETGAWRGEVKDGDTGTITGRLNEVTGSCLRSSSMTTLLGSRRCTGVMTPDQQRAQRARRLGRSLNNESADDQATPSWSMDELAISRSKLKIAAACTAERIGRFNLNKSVTGCSPLIRLMELDTLSIEIEIKRRRLPWRVLTQVPQAEQVAASVGAVEEPTPSGHPGFEL